MNGQHPGGAPGHAFISYVHEDRERVDRLQAVLEEAGIKVWRDTADLRPGQDWKIEISQAITARSLAFIACFSDNTESRDTSYQNEELILAVEQSRLRAPGDPWLIPVRFAECAIPAFDLGAGRTLDSLQRVDLFDGSWEPGIPRLITAIQGILHASGTPATASPARPPADGLDKEPPPPRGARPLSIRLRPSAIEHGERPGCGLGVVGASVGSVPGLASAVMGRSAPAVPGDARASGSSQARGRALFLAAGGTVLVAVSAGIYLASSLGAASSRAPGAGVGASSPAKPPRVGDACLVGTWLNGGFPSSVDWHGTNVPLYGGAGDKDHIYADGTDRDSWVVAAKLSGTYQGRPLVEIEQGVHTWTLRAMPGSHTVSMTDDGWSPGSTARYVYGGRTHKAGFVLAGTYSVGYRCTGSKLAWSNDGKVYETETRISDRP